MSGAPNRAASAVASSRWFCDSRSAGHPGAIVRNLALQRSLVPAERESHEAGYGFGALHAAIPRLDRYPGSARQDVFQMPGPLMGDRVQRLDPQIVISAG